MNWFTRLLLLITLAPQAAVGICDSDWVNEGLYCYYFSNFTATFEEADRNCTDSQAQILDILDNSENDYVYLQTAMLTDQSYWIGYQKVIGGIWRWKATGNAGLYTKWDIGEPDGEGGCTRLTPFGFGVWRDIACDFSLKFICKKMADCGRPADKPHATVEIPSHPSNSETFPAGAKAFYSCNEGYEYEDSSITKTSTCELGGVWMPSPLEDQCYPLQCPPPPMYNYVQTNGSENEYYKLGSVISYSCDAGYWFSAFEADVQEKYLTCQSDKQWGGATLNHCSAKECIRPITPNSVSNTSSNRVGTVALYRCNTAYRFADYNTTKLFTCGKETWEPSPEPCIHKRCAFHNVTNATPDNTSVLMGTTVIWSCNKGMQYPDTATRKSMYCNAEEEWDFKVTDACELKPCKGRPPNGTETNAHNWNDTKTYKYGDEVNYTCAYEGWTFPSKEPVNTRTIRCGPDGDWIPKNVGECTGEPIIVQTEHSTVLPEEGKNAVVFGSLGLIVVGVLLVCILLLDLTTIGKHLAMLRENLCPAADDEEIVINDKAEKWKSKINKEKPKTEIQKNKKPADTNAEYHEESENPVSMKSKEDVKAQADVHKESKQSLAGSHVSILDEKVGSVKSGEHPKTLEHKESKQSLAPSHNSMVSEKPESIKSGEHPKTIEHKESKKSLAPSHTSMVSEKPGSIKSGEHPKKFEHKESKQSLAPSHASVHSEKAGSVKSGEV